MNMYYAVYEGRSNGVHLNKLKKISALVES